ncbi:MAG: hypothetical protein K6348_05665 [Deferribacterales bacterium]
MIVGCIQNTVINGDVENNLKIYLDSISMCNSDIIVLPEMWFCGFDYKNIVEHSQKTPAMIEKISSKSDGKILVVTMPENDNNKIYNTVYIIKDGNILSKYRKQFLFSPQREDQYFSPYDNDVPVVLYNDMNISVATCYEIRFPEVFRIGAYMGAEVFLVPAIWPANKKDHWLTLLRGRSIENQAYVIGCSASKVINNDKELKCGYSAAFDPWGEALFVLDQSETIGYAEVSKEKVYEVRRSIPSLSDAKKRFDINKKPLSGTK